MEKEREDKILEAIGKQRKDIIAHVDKQFGSVIKKLEKHDEQFDKINGRFDRVEPAMLETRKLVEESSKDIKEVKTSLNAAVTNHESRIRRLEEKVGT